MFLGDFSLCDGIRGPATPPRPQDLRVGQSAAVLATKVGRVTMTGIRDLGNGLLPLTEHLVPTTSQTRETKVKTNKLRHGSTLTSCESFVSSGLELLAREDQALEWKSSGSLTKVCLNHQTRYKTISYDEVARSPWPRLTNYSDTEAEETTLGGSPGFLPP